MLLRLMLATSGFVSSDDEIISPREFRTGNYNDHDIFEPEESESDIDNDATKPDTNSEDSPDSSIDDEKLTNR